MRTSAFLAAVGSLSAFADAAPSLERARTLHAEGDYERAAREFEAVHAASKDPKLLFDIGLAYQLAGEPRQAVKAYTRYVAEVSNAANTVEVNQWVVELTGQMFKGAPPPPVDKLPPRIRLDQKTAWAAGEAVSIEATIEDPGGVFGPTLYYRASRTTAYVQAPMTSSGVHRYVGLVAPMDAVELEYFIEAFDAKGNGPARAGTPTYPFTMRIVAPGAAPAGAVGIVALPVGDEPPPELVRVAVKPRAGGRGPWGYATLGAGVLAAGLGVYFGLRAVSANDEWRAATDDVTLVAARGRTKSSMSAANVSWGAAALLAAGGGTLLLFTDF